MRSARRWFKLILGVVLLFFATTSIIPVVTSPVYAQGVFGHKQSGSSTSDEQQKQEQAEKDRQAKEQAEKERQAKEQAERQAQQQAERDRQAREQAERDRQAKEQAQREQQAKEQRERQEKEAAERRAQELKEQQAKEARERAEREQAERDRQAREQAEREKQAQAERDRQAKEQAERQAQQQAERDRQAKEQAAREARDKAAREARERTEQQNRNRVNTPTNPGVSRSGEKFERVGERPQTDERKRSPEYRPRRDYYPYDPGYRSNPPIIYYPVPVPVPSEPIPVPEPAPSSEPQVIVIDRGPTDHPEPQPPTEEEGSVPEVQTPDNTQSANDSVNGSVESLPAEAGTEAQDNLAEPPEIPSELLKPVEHGSPAEALDEICLGWLTRDMKLIEKHMDPTVPVRIYKQAKYSHKLSPKEFTELTADGLKQMNTREYRLKQVNKKNGKIYAQGVHAYVGTDGELHRVILACTLKKLNGAWAIVEIGYSPLAKDEGLGIRD